MYNKKMCLRLQDLGCAALTAQLKKVYITELPPKDPANHLVKLTTRTEIEQLTCKVNRGRLK